jgi:hypothetical protein
MVFAKAESPWQLAERQVALETGEDVDPLTETEVDLSPLHPTQAVTTIASIIQISLRLMISPFRLKSSLDLDGYSAVRPPHKGRPHAHPFTQTARHTGRKRTSARFSIRTTTY